MCANRAFTAVLYPLAIYIAFFLMCCVPSSSSAGMLQAADEYLVFTTQFPTPPNDFPILQSFRFTVSNSEQFTVQSVYSGPFADHSAPPPLQFGNRWETEVFFTKPSGPATGLLLFGIKINSRENDIQIGGGVGGAFVTWEDEEGHITSRDVPTPLLLLNFSVTPIGDPDGVFRVSNGSASSAVMLADLRFLADSEEIPLNAGIGTVPGFSPFSAQFPGFPNLLNLGPGEISDAFVFPDLTPGSWLFVEGTASAIIEDAGSASAFLTTSTFRFGHQTPLPEPSGIALFGAGILGLLAYHLRRSSALRTPFVRMPV